MKAKMAALGFGAAAVAVLVLILTTAGSTAPTPFESRVAGAVFIGIGVAFVALVASVDRAGVGTSLVFLLATALLAADLFTGLRTRWLNWAGLALFVLYILLDAGRRRRQRV